MLAGAMAHAAIPSWGDGLPALFSIVPELGASVSYRFVFRASIPPDATGRIRIKAIDCVIGQWADYFPAPEESFLEGKNALIAVDLGR